MAIDRIIAFYLTSEDASSRSRIRASDHFASVAEGFGHQLAHRRVGPFALWVAFEGDVSKLITQGDGGATFVVGPILDLPGSAHRQQDRRHIRDRFLRVVIGEQCATFENDYAGTVPVFYTTRGTISASNLEPVTVLSSNARMEDISLENLYGFLRFSHFVWDETLYAHVRCQPPDSMLELALAPPGNATIRPLATVQATDAGHGWSDEEVARRLRDLNVELVRDAFAPLSTVILPLSAGYDSRMLACAASDLQPVPDLRCFTYGPTGCLEVESARRLCHVLGFPWERVELPCRFLARTYLHKIGAVFGSSLHFHGMYQLEFVDCLRPSGFSARVGLTSGFMSGVPAGQHVSLLGIHSGTERLTERMGCFAQSRLWTQADLIRDGTPFRTGMEDLAESRFRAACDGLSGSPLQRSVVMDVWTRQRAFISYYPRTLEWLLPILSPHMSPVYANFFLSLSKRHLTDRRAVELMLRHHYSACASIASNSNGFRAPGGIGENVLCMLSRVARRAGASRIVPRRYRNEAITFDTDAVRASGLDGLWPLLQLGTASQEFMDNIVPRAVVERLAAEAVTGSVRSYDRLVTLQAVAYALHLLDRT